MSNERQELKRTSNRLMKKTEQPAETKEKAADVRRKVTKMEAASPGCKVLFKRTALNPLLMFMIMLVTNIRSSDALAPRLHFQTLTMPSLDDVTMKPCVVWKVAMSVMMSW